MSNTRVKFSNYLRLIVFIVAVAAAVVLIAGNIETFGRIVLVLIGFGVVVLVHEFGHFLIAKLGDIKVEAFSIGFPPILAGIQRTEKGFRVRILPELLRRDGDESQQDLISFHVGRKAKPGETEYRIGLIPFGGFVKMLGQDDTKAAEATDDPRSYANKPVGIRMGVIAAGVLFNAISAVIIFMIVFLIGIERMPAVVGGLEPNSPAARAGLVAGDEIIEIGGKSKSIDFSNIAMAAALSGKDEKVKLRVKHEDGLIEDYKIAPEAKDSAMGKIKLLGILPPQSLTIAKVSNADELLKQTGLVCGDRVTSIAGQDVNNHWDMADIVADTLQPTVKISTQRKDTATGNLQPVKTQLALDWLPAEYEVQTDSDLSHIYSMVPRLRITAVSDGSAQERAAKDISNEITVAVDPKSHLLAGDIILAAGEIENPTYRELREVTTEYEDKELPIKVLRKQADGFEKTVTVTVTPKRQRGSDRVVIGIAVALDAEHAVVAETVDTFNGKKLDIPRGATITAINETPVSNFYEIVSQLRANVGREVNISYKSDEKITGGVVVKIENPSDFITVKSVFADAIPFVEIKKLYKAASPVDAIFIGCDKTIMFITQAYITLQRALSGLVSPKNFMGPVGIVALSYRIVAEQPLVYYVYFIGLISAFIAVFNFLPMLPFDGGHIVMLAIEKIKGSPLNQRLQEVITYAGLVLIGAFFLYVTFNDIVRSFFTN